MVAASASAGEVSDRDRFQLWAACASVRLLVEDLTKDAAKIGLHKKDIETAVRSRLRGARIYDDDALSWLSKTSRVYVNVAVVGRAFNVNVDLLRSVEVLLPYWHSPEGIGPLVGYAATWSAGSTGTHSNHSSYILSSIALEIDNFIDEYLRVNADACK